ncbi:MAG: DUF302 domain-containing protein [Candidatus Baltobacteraceae bacterium]
MTKPSRYPYAETIVRLTQAIVDAGNRIFATIDQSKAAQEAGLALRPTTLILFGNPKGGTPLMEAYPLFALDLPLKLLVWEEDGRCKVAFVPASEIAARYGITGMDRIVSAMDAALRALIDSVA